jgi:hypothetical protein
MGPVLRISPESTSTGSGGSREEAEVQELERVDVSNSDIIIVRGDEESQQTEETPTPTYSSL